VEQEDSLIASRRLEWWLPQYEVEQGNPIASRRLEWRLPQYEVEQGNLMASRRLEWCVAVRLKDSRVIVTSRLSRLLAQHQPSRDGRRQLA